MVYECDESRRLDKLLEVEALVCLNQRGRIWHKTNRCDESLADLNMSLEIESSYALPLSHCSETHHIWQITSSLNKSLEITPNEAFALGCHGEIYIYLTLNKYEEST